MKCHAALGVLLARKLALAAFARKLALAAFDGVPMPSVMVFPVAGMIGRLRRAPRGLIDGATAFDLAPISTPARAGPAAPRRP